ncbi:WDR93 protein, partial [Nothoprocta ornata]|nr:WDR93 protein [Nothoprocta pentlandii]NWY07261.1 WDR93 protein [Nothoprocta ornata]
IVILLFQALVFCWDGTVSLMDTATSHTICYFNIPPSYAVASPWQPVFTMDPEDQWLILRGDKQQAGILAQSTASHSSIFIFDFNSYLLQESFPREPDLPDKPLQDLPWTERCNIFFRD